MRSFAPRTMARLAGVVYLFNFAFGPALFALRKYVVVKDAAATAANVAAHKDLFELGFAGHLIATVSYLVVTALFYSLFRPVNKTISLAAAFFSVVGCAVLAVTSVFYIAPVALQGIEPPLVLLFFKLYSQGYNVSLVFFAFYCTSIGYLIIRSTFLPRILGVGMMLSGLGWLTFLAPSFARVFYPYGMLFGLGEMVLLVWLIIFGVNSQKWHEMNA